MKGKDEYTKTLQTICKLGIKGKINKTFKKKNTASPPGQDLHPDWDRFRGTMLYPLSCGELAMKGKQIIRLHATSGLCTCFDSKITLLQKLRCLI